MNHILNVKESVFNDESLTNYEFHSIPPYSTSGFKNNDEIRIPLQQQDIYTLPSESRLLIEGVLTKSTKSTTDPVPSSEGFIDNAMAYLFSEIRYELNGIEIDRARNPGMTSTLKGLVSFTSADIPHLQNAAWGLQDRNAEHFSFCIPLRMLLGFAEDFRKIIINLKQELILLRDRSDHNVYVCKTDNVSFNLTLTNIQWQVPFLRVSDEYRLKLMNILKNNAKLMIPFRTWELCEYPNVPSSTSTLNWPVKLTSHIEKPRFIIVGFQTDRSYKLEAENDKFDHCNVRNIKLFVGTQVFPYTPLNVNFNKNQFSVLYENFVNFKSKYYHPQGDELRSFVTPTQFLKSFPIWVIDCSRQSETVKTGSVDIRLEIDASTNFPVSTHAFCLIISDTLFEYSPFTGIVRQVS